jgi:DNA-binding CsgD family transcriptional regulator
MTIVNSIFNQPLLDSKGDPLTIRESQCIYLMLLGNTTKETARELTISPRTVEVYITNVKHKLHCCSKSQIIAQISKNKINQNRILGLFSSLENSEENYNADC